MLQIFADPEELMEDSCLCVRWKQQCPIGAKCPLLLMCGSLRRRCCCGPWTLL